VRVRGTRQGYLLGERAMESDPLSEVADCASAGLQIVEFGDQRRARLGADHRA